MFHNLKIPEQCETLWQTCQSLVPKILKDISLQGNDVLITKNKPIDPESGCVYLVKEGTINEVYEGQLMVIYEEGDLIGVEGVLQTKSSRYENDFAVKAVEYNGQQLLDEIMMDKSHLIALNQYLACLAQSYQLLACHFNQQDTAFNPDFRHYDTGDVIIKENTEGDEVFTLISGSAKVMLDNTEVGEINQDEIFGAIAALTNTKRNASIIATSPCDTIVVKSDSFRDLLAARPDTVQKLITDMARTIVSSNERIIDLSKN